MGQHWGLVLTLQDFEVLDVGVLGVDVELDASHGEIAEDAVEHLAKSSTGARNHRLAMGAVLYVSTFRAEMRRRPARIKAWERVGLLSVSHGVHTQYHIAQPWSC